MAGIKPTTSRSGSAVLQPMPFIHKVGWRSGDSAEWRLGKLGHIDDIFNIDLLSGIFCSKRTSLFLSGASRHSVPPSNNFWLPFRARGATRRGPLWPSEGLRRRTSLSFRPDAAKLPRGTTEWNPPERIWRHPTNGSRLKWEKMRLYAGCI